ALGKFWHRHHIRCSVCSKPIPQKPDRYERDEKVYCRADYLRLFAPKCVGCNRAVEIQDAVNEVINAFGGIWHVYCFTCQMCRCRFDDTRGQFYVFENRPFC
ncbi:glucocorticoid receptor-like (DNA-binding domain), partial [Ramicandelaber brevisporus]